VEEIVVEAGVEDGVAQERPTNLHQPRKFELKYVPIKCFYES
jgi:hypothetical protein